MLISGLWIANAKTKEMKYVRKKILLIDVKKKTKIYTLIERKKSIFLTVCNL